MNVEILINFQSKKCRNTTFINFRIKILSNLNDCPFLLENSGNPNIAAEVSPPNYPYKNKISIETNKKMSQGTFLIPSF